MCRAARCALFQLTALRLRQGNCSRKARPRLRAYKMRILYHPRQKKRGAPLAHPMPRATAKTKCAFCIIGSLARLPLLGCYCPRAVRITVFFSCIFAFSRFPCFDSSFLFQNSKKLWESQHFSTVSVKNSMFLVKIAIFQRGGRSVGMPSQFAM